MVTAAQKDEFPTPPWGGNAGMEPRIASPGLPFCADLPDPTSEIPKSDRYPRRGLKGTDARRPIF